MIASIFQERTESAAPRAPTSCGSGTTLMGLPILSETARTRVPFNATPPDIIISEFPARRVARAEILSARDRCSPRTIPSRGKPLETNEITSLSAKTVQVEEIVTA